MMRKASQKRVAPKRRAAPKKRTAQRKRNPFRLVASPMPPRVTYSTQQGAANAARHWLDEEPRAHFVEVFKEGHGRVSTVTRSSRKRRENPKPKRKGAPRRKNTKTNTRKAGRRNPAEAAKAMFEKFHGRPSTKTVKHRVAQHYHEALANLGDLVEMTVLLPDEQEVVLAPKGVKLASSEDGGQLEFLGGDQKLNLSKLGLAATLPKDRVVIGPVLSIAYRTEKDFDKFKPLTYEHEFGEDGGELPTLCYDVRSQLMFLAGGSYQNLKPGIVN